MKFEFTKEAILGLLQMAENAIPVKTTLQVLSNFLLDLKGNQLKIIATDLDLTVVSQVEVVGEQDGGIIINAKKFVEVIRELSNVPAICSVDDYVLNIKMETGYQCSIAGFDVSEFPSLPSEENQNSFELSIDQLHFLYEKTAFAVSNDFNSRLNLTGIFWKLDGQNMNMVATDGHRLGKSEIPFEGSKIDGVIVSPKAINQVIKMSDFLKETQFRVSLNESYIQITSSNFTIFSKQIEGQYPDYNKVIPDPSDQIATVNREELIQVLKRVSAITNNKTRQVKFSFEKELLRLSSQNQDLGGESEESLKSSYKGDSVELGFNAIYLLEVLKLVHSEFVQIQVSTELGPALIRPEEINTYFFIVMPVRLS